MDSQEDLTLMKYILNSNWLPCHITGSKKGSAFGSSSIDAMTYLIFGISSFFNYNFYICYYTWFLKVIIFVLEHTYLLMALN